MPFVTNRKAHVWHLFVIRTKNRDALQKYLKDKGIQTLIHYPIPPHKQRAYAGWNDYSLPITEKIHNDVISLPMSSVLEKEETDLIISELNRFNSKH